MPKLRVHNFCVSLDGFGAGLDQGADAPLGVGGERLHEWVFRTRYAGGDEVGADNDLLAAGDREIGATIMGRNMFGPVRGEWPDHSWTGWWGENPPYHHDTFVMTHRPRRSVTMQGGTTFHFVTDSPEAVLKRAVEAAQGQDVRLGGARERSGNSWRPGWSTNCTWRSCRSCLERASGCSKTSARCPATRSRT